MAGETAAAAAASIISSSLLFAPPPLINHHHHPRPSHQEESSQQLPLPPPAKKKRNLPGTPDPDAEVIALSPRTLLATNRFVCEICGKGFQRDQNLQLHRRGHNLPWKLKQRSNGKDQPPRKRVYVCPEPSCVHHSANRALGDLTGIKKHFCRKHGEKKWKCDKCSKKYAVQSDWKAHAKTCGTREYRCDCGTLFSRRDSFVTHRAFCDALAEETARQQHQHQLNNASSCISAPPPYLFVAAAAGGAGSPPPPPNDMNMTMLPPAAAAARVGGGLSLPSMSMSMSSMLQGHIGGGAGIGLLLPVGGAPAAAVPPPQMYADLFAAPPVSQLDWLYGNSSGKLASSNAASSELLMTSVAAAASGNKQEMTGSVPSVFSGQQQQQHAKPADMSATALLQKAAQMGAVTSSGMSMGGALDLEPGADDGGHRHQSSDGGGLLMMSQQLTAAPAGNGNGNGNMPYDDVLSAVRLHGGLNNLKDAAVAVAVGREETRDFLGVGVQALCSSSLNGWI